MWAFLDEEPRAPQDVFGALFLMSLFFQIAEGHSKRSPADHRADLRGG
jgi:hypothetical protein